MIYETNISIKDLQEDVITGSINNIVNNEIKEDNEINIKVTDNNSVNNNISSNNNLDNDKNRDLNDINNEKKEDEVNKNANI